MCCQHESRAPQPRLAECSIPEEGLCRRRQRLDLAVFRRLDARWRGPLVRFTMIDPPCNNCFAGCGVARAACQTRNRSRMAPRPWTSRAIEALWAYTARHTSTCSTSSSTFIPDHAHPVSSAPGLRASTANSHLARFSESPLQQAHLAGGHGAQGFRLAK